jgi:hypothetical protein
VNCGLFVAGCLLRIVCYCLRPAACVLLPAPLLLLFLTIFPMNTAIADEFKVIPSVSLKHEYTEYADDMITTLSSEINVSDRTERLDANLSGRIDRLVYAEDDAFNAVNHYYKGNLSYLADERMRVSCDASYTRDSRRDRDIEETGIELGTATRDRYHFAVSASAALTEITSAAISYSYDRDDFDDPDFINYRSYLVNLSFTHNFSYVIPLTVAQTNFGYSRYDFTNSVAENYSWSLGGSWEMSELFSLVANLGGRYTFFKSDRISQDPVFFSEEYPDIPIEPENDFIIRYRYLPYIQKSESWGLMWGVSLTYKGEFTNAALNLSQDVKALSGKSGTAERTSLLLDAGYNFTEDFRGSLSLRYHLNQSDQDDSGSDDEQTLQAGSRVRYNFTRYLSLEVSYRFTAQLDSAAYRNAVFARLIFEYPVIE